MPSEVFLMHLATPTAHIVPITVDQTPQNERIKACVGSMKANNYARSRSDCMNFHSYIMGRPTDAVGGVFDTLGHSHGPQHMS